MAISTYKIFLMHGSVDTVTTYSKLVDIKDFPDLGGAPETLDTTTLSDKMRTSINGIQELDSLTFTANYDEDDFDAVKALDDGAEHQFAVWMGGTEGSNGEVTPTGSEGKFEFSGYLSVFVNGGGVNEVVNMTITIAASTVISKAS